jgi:glycosyltransferase involved in cell wall biosynthesis
MPRLFIGMPVRNGAAFIGEAIASLQAQTYTDWRLIVSDNCSEDDTAQICERIAETDARIEVRKTNANVGASGNFLRVLEIAEGELFMWAAADDRWRPSFIGTCVANLDAHPTVGMAFTNLVNIDPSGRVVRTYPRIPALTGAPNWRTVSRYLLSREICGKANLIYSVYRLALCRKVADEVGFPDCWGGDMALVLGAIARGGVIVDDQVMFEKRLSQSEAHRTTSPTPPDTGGEFPLEQYESYKAGLLAAVAGTGFSWLTNAVMSYRFCWARLGQLQGRLVD